MRCLIRSMLALLVGVGGIAFASGCSRDEPTNPNLKIPDVPPGGAGIKNPPMKVYGKKDKA